MEPLGQAWALFQQAVHLGKPSLAYPGDAQSGPAHLGDAGSGPPRNANSSATQAPPPTGEHALIDDGCAAQQGSIAGHRQPPPVAPAPRPLEPALWTGSPPCLGWLGAAVNGKKGDGSRFVPQPVATQTPGSGRDQDPGAHHGDPWRLSPAPCCGLPPCCGAECIARGRSGGGEVGRRPEQPLPPPALEHPFQPLGSAPAAPPPCGTHAGAAPLVLTPHRHPQH